jgi:tetratricopeptide (TPR) repeat protein
MKKRERLIKKDNVILFPELDKRLLEKGLERLEEKQFREAIEYLSNAREINPDNEDIYIGLVLANFELGNFQRANDLAKEMLQTGIGDYFQVVDLYIMILVQQHQYEEIIVTIEALLEEKEVPSEKLDHLTRMLQFSRKMVDEKQEESNGELEREEAKQELKLFSILDPKEQIHVAAMLSNKNVRAYLDEVTTFLAAPLGEPFFKTMLLNVLKEQEYEREVVVAKFGMKEVVVPFELFGLHHHPDYSPIYHQISQVLENDDPILLENIKQLMDRYFFLLYPFRLEPLSVSSWAAAFHYTGLTYFGMEQPLSELELLYDSEEESIRSAIALISRIEEFSSP